MEKKWYQVSKGSGSEEKFSFCTFNTLAQAYTSGKYFPYAFHNSLTKSKRLSNVKKQIHSLNPDVVCLQEVDFDLADSFWRKTVSDPMGYTLFYVKKPFKKDGEAIMWKSDLFDPVTLRLDEKAMSAGIKSDGTNRFHVEFDEYPECCMSEEQMASIGAKGSGTSCIATAAVLRHKSSGALFVFTAVHVFWRWMFPTVQLGQMTKAGELSEILVSLVRQQYPEESAKCGVFSTVAGDMNADTNGETYLGGKHKFPHTVYEVWPPEAKGAGYTNYTNDFKGWLDHIFWFDTPEFPLEVDAVVKLPTNEVLSEEVALPNSRFGSDHIPLMILTWKRKKRKEEGVGGMLAVTKIFLSGIVSVTSLLFIMEIGYFSQCTPMTIDKNMLSPEELFVYVSIECGKSPVIMFMFVATYLFTVAFSFFSYYVLKWANVPSFVWYLVEVPLILFSIVEIYYHHRILKENGYPVLECESVRRYIEVIALSHEYGSSLIIIMMILMLISFVYKKKKSKETEEKND